MNNKSIKTSRTFLPEILAPGTGLSPATNKSVVPFNNVHTIQDVLNGNQYRLPGGGGSWSDLGGQESEPGSFKENADHYKREERDMEILSKILSDVPVNQEEWKVRVPGGTKVFPSFSLANKYMKKMKDKGINVSWIVKTKFAQDQSKVTKNRILARTLDATYKIESIDMSMGTIQNGACFCIGKNLFLTCAHVIAKYDKNTVNDIDFQKKYGNLSIRIVDGNKKYVAKILKSNTALDLALVECYLDSTVLQIDEKITVGDDILVVGSPHGFQNNVSYGNVGSVDREIYFHNGAPKYMFVDASVFSGNSGGPIVNLDSGKVIGVMTAIVAKGGEYGLNSGLPSLYINQFLN